MKFDSNKLKDVPDIQRTYIWSLDFNTNHLLTEHQENLLTCSPRELSVEYSDNVTIKFKSEACQKMELLEILRIIKLNNHDVSCTISFGDNHRDNINSVLSFDTLLDVTYSINGLDYKKNDAFTIDTVMTFKNASQTIL